MHPAELKRPNQVYRLIFRSSISPIFFGRLLQADYTKFSWPEHSTPPERHHNASCGSGVFHSGLPHHHAHPAGLKPGAFHSGLSHHHAHPAGLERATPPRPPPHASCRSGAFHSGLSTDIQHIDFADIVSDVFYKPTTTNSAGSEHSTPPRPPPHASCGSGGFDSGLPHHHAHPAGPKPEALHSAPT